MKTLLSLLFSLGFLLALAAEEVPLDEFMRRVRNPYPTSSYAILEGEVSHLRRGSPREEYPIYFGLILQPERMTGQIIINQSEGYILGQNRKGGDGSTTVLPMKENRDTPQGSLLGHVGIRASDLTMSFVYYPVVKEILPGESLRTVACRIVLLEAPDKSEWVKVYIARDYYFPLKAEFLKSATDTAPYRTLEVNSFQKSGDFYYTDQLGLYGPGWRTLVDFRKSADVAAFDPEQPKNIIRPLSK